MHAVSSPYLALKRLSCNIFTGSTWSFTLFPGQWKIWASLNRLYWGRGVGVSGLNPKLIPGFTKGGPQFTAKTQTIKIKSLYYKSGKILCLRLPVLTGLAKSSIKIRIYVKEIRTRTVRVAGQPVSSPWVVRTLYFITGAGESIPRV